jgi:HD-GYP domain-containing protein (c-di-GMP phosphodiesterase class II)
LSGWDKRTPRSAGASAAHDRLLPTLLEFATHFHDQEDAHRMMEQTLRTALREVGADLGYLMLRDDDTSELMTEVAVCLGAERPFPASRAWGDGPEGHAAKTGRAFVTGRAGGPQAAGAEAPPHPAETDGTAANTLCVPLIQNGALAAGDGALGVLALVSASGGKGFSADHLETARALAALATITIANVRRHLSLRRSFLRSLQAMAKAIDDKVPYMQGHSARVARVCELVAARLDVEPEVADDLVQGALLHEIGKIYVPDHVLLKSGQLTPDEYTILKQYPVIGYEICEPLGLGDDILMLIRNHAERLDGTGYPDGLKFGELPLPLRILSAADAFDAMSSYRPYRKGMDSRGRNEELNRFAGTQFDPVVVETLKALLNAGELDELYRDHWQIGDEEPAANEGGWLRAA